MQTRASGGEAQVVFSDNPTVPFFTSAVIFAELVDYYNSYDGGSQWNHNLFTAYTYRNDMAQNLVGIHPWLDANNDFLTNVNSDPNIVGGPYTIPELMNYISWIGLEETQAYDIEIETDPNELAKKNYVEDAARNHYTHNCSF